LLKDFPRGGLTKIVKAFLTVELRRAPRAFLRLRNGNVFKGLRLRDSTRIAATARFDCQRKSEPDATKPTGSTMAAMLLQKGKG